MKPETKLGNLTLPLAPMLGCFGVAPPRGQAISTATSGEYGGNMDYRGFIAGTIAYFPVFVPGALVHVGDGHAIQGDGEIVGTGIEISMDVQFTVRLIKGKRIEWPRGHEFVPELIEAFPGEVDSVNVRKPTLEDVFIHFTGHRLEESVS